MQFSPFSLFKEKNNYLWLIALIINIYILFPMLGSAYILDDSIWSYTRGTLAELKWSPFELYYHHFKGFINIGVFRPLNFYYIFIFTWINSLKIYKFLFLIMIIFNLLLFGYLLRLLTQSRMVSILAMGMMPILFQFRAYYDAILLFHWQQQTILSCTLISLILLLKYISTQKKYILLFSLLSYFFALLIHETAYFLCILHIIIIIFFRTSPRKLKYVLKTASPFLLLSLTFILTTLLIRVILGLGIASNENTAYTELQKTPTLAYVLNLNILTFLLTYVKQVFSTFPLSYFFIDPNHLFIYKNKFFVSWPTIFNFTITFFFYFILLKELHSEAKKYGHKKFLMPLLLLGLSLLFLPGILTSLSPKYQNEIVWGIGYIPVYISYFGSSMLMTICIYSIYQTLKNNYPLKTLFYLTSIGLALVISCVSVLNYNNNKIVVDHLNLLWLYPKSTIEESMKNGLFKTIPSSSSLFIESKNFWDTSAFYLMHSGIKFNYVGTKGSYLSDPKAKNVFPKKSLEKPDFHIITNNRNCFYLRYDSTSEKNGYVILGEIKDLKISNETLHCVTSERIHIYVRSLQNDFKNLSITGRSIDSKYTQHPQPFITKDLNINSISSGSGWTICEISKPGQLLDLKSINVNLISKHLELSDLNLSWIVLWQGGFSLLEGTSDNNWRWCASEGDLIITNLSHKPKKVLLEMTFASGHEELSDLEMKSPRFSEKLKINATGYHYLKKVTIPAGRYKVHFASNARRVNTSLDYRTLIFRVINFQLKGVEHRD